MGLSVERRRNEWLCLEIDGEPIKLHFKEVGGGKVRVVVHAADRVVVEKTKRGVEV